MASKSINELFTGKFPTVFKLFRHRVNASSNFATGTFFIVFKMCRHRVNAVLVEKILYGKITHHLGPEIRKKLVRGMFGNKNSGFILVNNLLSIEIEIQFLEVAMQTLMPHKLRTRMESGISTPSHKAPYKHFSNCWFLKMCDFTKLNFLI